MSVGYNAKIIVGAQGTLVSTPPVAPITFEHLLAIQKLVGNLYPVPLRCPFFCMRCNEEMSIPARTVEPPAPPHSIPVGHYCGRCVYHFKAIRRQELRDAVIAARKATVQPTQIIMDDPFGNPDEK